MPSDFLPVLLLMAIGLIIAAAIPVLARLLGRDWPDPVKGSVFECGVTEPEPPMTRTHIRYYLTALSFIVFDIEIAFLYPWAVAMKRFEVKTFVLLEVLLFLGILVVAYVWEWKKGALDWE